MDRLQSMRVFVRVAELGSFSAVAHQLGVARSVVTRQVAALEAELGAKLMTRSTRKLALTSSGTAYLEKCREILSLVSAAEAEVAQARAHARGHLRVGLPLSYGLKRLVPLFNEFAERHPEVSLELDYTDRRLDLIEQGFDLAIRVTARLAPGDVVRRLASARLITVAAPAYLAQHGRPREPKDLEQHTCLIYNGDATRGAWTYRAGPKGERVETVYVRSRITANNGEALLEAASRGLGIALQPDFIAEPYLADGRVVPVLEDFAAPELGVYALLPGAGQVAYRVRVLIDFLAERLGADDSRAHESRAA